MHAVLARNDATMPCNRKQNSAIAAQYLLFGFFQLEDLTPSQVLGSSYPFKFREAKGFSIQSMSLQKV